MNFDPQRKLADARSLELTGVTDVIPAPSLARAKWVRVKPDHALGTPALNPLSRRSPALVMARLTQNLQRELNP